MELLAAVIGLFGAVLGGIVGAWATKRLTKPKPVVLIDFLEISAANPANSLTNPNREIMEGCNADPFIRVNFPQRGQVQENEYIKSLNEARDQIDELLQFTIPSIKLVAQRIQTALAVEDYNSLEVIWAQSQLTLWGFLEGAYIRDEFLFSQPEPDYTKMSRIREILTDPDGDFFVPIPNTTYNISFIWTNRKSIAEKSKKFAERMARAMAYRVKDDIRDAIVFLITGRDYASSLYKLKDTINTEIQLFQRFLVQGQISNIGGTPFSVLNNGRMFLQLKGYPYNITDVNGNQRQEICKENVEIAIVIANDQGNYGSPIAVTPGSAVRFQALASTRIRDLSPNDAVVNAYRGGERTFYIGMAVVQATGESTKIIYTESRLFRDWRNDIRIPPKKT